MNKAVTWARLLFAAALKNPALWAADLILLLFLLILRGTVLPYGENRLVAVYGGGEGVSSLLSKEDTLFEFRQASSEEEARELVLSGRADCGFIFRENEPVTYLYSRYTIKGKAAKETVFCHFYPERVRESLLSSAEEVFGRGDEALLEELEEGYDAYLVSGLTFAPELLGGDAFRQRALPGTELYPLLQGFLYLLALAVMMKNRGKAFASCLYPLQRALFYSLTLLSKGLVLALPFLLLSFI